MCVGVMLPLILVISGDVCLKAVLNNQWTFIDLIIQHILNNIFANMTLHININIVSAANSISTN